MFPLRRERDKKRQIKFKNPAVEAAVRGGAVKKTDKGSSKMSKLRGK